MNYKVYDKRAENNEYYIFNTKEEFEHYNYVVWSCNHELVFLGFDNNETLTFERKEG